MNGKTILAIRRHRCFTFRSKISGRRHWFKPCWIVRYFPGYPDMYYGLTLEDVFSEEDYFMLKMTTEYFIHEYQGR